MAFFFSVGRHIWDPKWRDEKKNPRNRGTQRFVYEFLSFTSSSAFSMPVGTAVATRTKFVASATASGSSSARKMLIGRAWSNALARTGFAAGAAIFWVLRTPCSGGFEQFDRWLSYHLVVMT